MRYWTNLTTNADQRIVVHTFDVLGRSICKRREGFVIVDQIDGWPPFAFVQIGEREDIPAIPCRRCIKLHQMTRSEGGSFR
jgi:hypothetical protein